MSSSPFQMLPPPTHLLSNCSPVLCLAAKSSVVPNIPIVNQYIQTSVPFYQPPVYSYEDLQMMQQRLPHMVSV